MAHSYISKLYIASLIIFFNIYALMLVRINSFRKIISTLKAQKVVGNIPYGKLDFIFKYQIKITKILALKKCLTTSIAFFFVLRQLGHKAKINISISNKDEFFSHAWVSVDKYEYFNEEKDLVDIITIG